MATLSELKARAGAAADFCQSTLWPQVDRFEAEHSVPTAELRSAFQKALPWFAGSVLLFWLHAPQWSIPLGAVVGAVLFLPTSWRYSRAQMKRMAALKVFRASIKQQAIQYLDPKFVFEAHPPFPQSKYRECGCFPESYDRSEAQDFCSGTVGETRFELVEIATYKRHETKDSRGRKTITYKKIFRGLLFTANFNKNFSGHVTVRTDQGEATFGFLARGVQRFGAKLSTLKLVELENPDFEKQFKVHATDPTQARYILTPDFMERMVEFKRRMATDVQFSFREGEFTVIIPRSTDFMELGRGLTNLTSSVDSVLNDLVACLEIIEDFKLNERIWNKAGA